MTDQPFFQFSMSGNRWLVPVLPMILAVGVCGTWWMVWQADQEVRRELLANGQRVAQAMAPLQITSLAGDATDLDSPHYQRLKRQLILIRQAYAQCRFVYLMGRRADGTIFLFVDSEPPESEDYSPPGQVYGEAGEPEAWAFDSGGALVTGPTPDRWGTWITAYVPVRSPWSSDILAVCGLDLDARDWNRRRAQAAVLPGLLTLFAAGSLLIGRWLSVVRRRNAETKEARWYIEPGWVAVVGLAGTLFCARIACNREALRRQIAFEQLADSETGRAAEFLEDLERVELEGLAKLFESSEEVTADEFVRYVNGLSRSPGIRAWEWLPAVPAAEREHFEQQVRASGLPNFAITQRDGGGRQVPLARRDVYYPVTFVFPVSGNEAALGYDAGSEPLRRTALERAARSGLPTATAPIVLVQDHARQQGMVVFRPVFCAGQPQRVRGFVVAVFRLDRLLDAVWEKTSVHLDVALLRGNQPALPLAGAPHEVPAASQKLAVTRPVSSCGEVFFLTAHPGPEFLRSFPARAGWLTALAGTLCTALVVILIQEPLRRRDELETLVAERTASLRESEARYEQLAEHSRTFAWEVDAHGLCTYVSRVVQQVLGYQPDELVGKKHVYDLWPESDREALTRTIQEMRDRQLPVSNFENRVVARDGSVLWVLGSAFPLVDPQGRLRGYRGWNTEITQRKHAELDREKLLAAAERTRQTLLNLLEDQKRAEAERLRLVAAIEQVADMIVITDAQGSIQYVNAAFESVTGYARLAVFGQNPRLLKSGHQDEAFYRELWRTVSAGQTWQGRMVNRRKDGSLFTEDATISPVVDSAGRIANYVAVKRDVTEHLRAFEERVHLQEQLRQAQKVESIGRLAGGIAHDFNNMLSVILGYGERILAAQSPQDPLRDDVRQIVEAARRSATLTRQLLAFGRRQTLQPEVLDLNGIATNLEEVLRRLLGEHIELRLVLADDLCCVLADPGQIEHVIINLAINARDAMPRGGQLVLQTANVTLGETEAQRPIGLQPGRYAMLVIRDTGCGMDQETLAHLFEPFFTTKEKGKGTGLGLPTAYGVIQQSGGQLAIESTPGEGTTARIYLPQTLREPQVKPLPTAAGKVSGAGLRILVAEDEAPLRALIHQVLAQLGYQVHVAASGREALRQVEEQGVTPALLLTDVVMPEMSGIALVEHLRRILPDLKVLYMSGYTDDLQLQHGPPPARTHFLAKPFEPRELAAKIRQVLQETVAIPERGKRILMIDDEAAFRDLVQHFCTKRGHEFAGGGTAQTALDALAAQSFDVLLLDMNIPGTNGRQILQKIRSQGYQTPTIVLTGDAFSVDRESLRPLGVTHVLEKSGDCTTLLQMIEALESP